MDLKEFSNEFSTMLNSFGITPNIVLDEYEKSVFLTEAQEQLVIEAYSGRNSIFGASFEETEELRNYLNPLVATITLIDENTVPNAIGLTPYSTIYTRNDSIWFITFESVEFDDEKLGCANGTTASVVPITQDELHRVIRNPFRGPTRNRVLRLNSDSNTLELVSKYKISKYTIRYLSKLSPIVLVNLNDGLSIDGVYFQSNTFLPESLHRTLLIRAVQLAIQAKTQLSSKN